MLMLGSQTFLTSVRDCKLEPVRNCGNLSPSFKLLGCEEAQSIVVMGTRIQWTTCVISTLHQGSGSCDRHDGSVQVLFCQPVKCSM